MLNKEKSKRLAKLKQVMSKKPFPLPNTDEPVPYCLLDKLITTYVEEHLVPSQRPYCQLLAHIVMTDLADRGFEMVEEDLTLEKMTIFKKPAPKTEGSLPKNPWLGDIPID